MRTQRSSSDPKPPACRAMRRPCAPARLGTWMLAAFAATISGCTVYHARALPTGPDLIGAAALHVPARHFGLPGLAPAPLDPARGFTAVNLMELAVAGDPQLKAARARAGVARAQLFAAGLLPDPQISAGLSRSTLHTGYSVGVMEDVRTLLTMHAAKEAAAAHVRQVNLSILWQEWQVAERARELFLQARQSRRLRAVLAPKRRLLTALLVRDERELSRGAVGAGQVAAELAEWNAAEKQWRSLALQDNRTWHQIDALLGLKPGTRVRLRGTAQLRALSPRRFRAALGALPRRRPDLLALRAGYHSAEQKLRMQILRQFPMIGVGVKHAEAADDAVHTVGLDVSLTLPLFNRNRGAIAIARASRAYLYRLYQSRVDNAANQADQLFDAARIMRRQLRAARTHLKRLLRTEKVAHASYEHGDLDLASYAVVVANVASARVQVIGLRTSLARARAALDMLLALPL